VVRKRRDAPQQAPQLIAQRYELLRELGEGGTATVWLAQDRTLERPVAIKFLDVSPRERAAMTEQFLREARIAAAVRHRNVIQILDFGTHEGTPFMAMESLTGETMADRFDRKATFELREVVEIAAHCLEGLAAVHEAGIVHRDLKPENIFLVREPTGLHPKLLDFGISRTVDKRSGRHSAIPTEDGRLVGTPEYMSPEQARGRSDIDLRTDLYGLGVVMYEALTGRLPYDSEHTGEVLLQVVAGGAPRVSQAVPAVSEAISAVVARAMAVDREQRYTSAMEMRSALLDAAQPLLSGAADPIALPVVRRDLRGLRTTALTGPQVTPSPAPTEAQAASRAPGSNALKLGVAVAALAALAGGALALVALREPASGEPAPRYIVVQGAPAPAAPQDPVASQAPGAAAQAQAGGIVAAPTAPAATVAASVARALPADDPSGERVAETSAGRKRRPPAAPAANAGDAQNASADDQSRALSAAFNRQKGPVVECLNRHGQHVEDRVQMAVRLTLDAGGRVEGVEVLPPELAASPTSACIAGAVRGMRFGAQPAPISIRVPLTARRSPG
jgi:serine/threonine-protein kinase